jgi:hypothetical protein
MRVLAKRRATRPGRNAFIAHVAAGSAVLSPYKRTIRCPMTTHAQPGLPADPEILFGLDRWHDRMLGIYARVVAAGRVAVGDSTVVSVGVAEARTG